MESFVKTRSHQERDGKKEKVSSGLPGTSVAGAKPIAINPIETTHRPQARREKESGWPVRSVLHNKPRGASD